MSRVKAHFIGTRRHDFTVLGPATGEAVYVVPGRPVSLDEADAAALLARDPHLWEQVRDDVAEEARPPKREKVGKS